MAERFIKIAFAGGGTAGHLNPAIALIEEITTHCSLKALYFINPGKIEAKVLPARFPWIKTVPLRVKGFERPLHSVKNVVALSLLIPALIKAMGELRKFKPDCVFCTGGYITGPVALAAWLLKIPVYLHEQNSVVGVANRMSLRFAKRIFLSFPESLETIPLKYKNKAIVTGNPVRKPKMEREELEMFMENLGLRGEKLILVMGGSRGSDFLNQMVEKIHDRIKARFIVLTGSSGWTERLKHYPNVAPFDYLEEVPDLLSIADTAITRGGATTVWELYTSGLPALIIPWEGATEGHQFLNAKFLERAGTARVLRESEATADRVVRELSMLLNMKRRPSLDPNEILKKILSGISEVRLKCFTT